MKTTKQEVQVAELKNTGELLSLVACLGSAVGNSLEDGKFDASDIANFLVAIGKLPDAVEDVALVSEELTNATSEQLDELHSLFEADFDIPQDELEAAVEDHIELGLDILDLVRKYYL